MLSPSMEDYLEEIYRFSLHNNVVRVSDIANRLDVTMPSVNNAIRNLHNENYLIYQRYKELVLTDKGRRVGKFLVERNSILQRFLLTIKSDCDVGAEAEAMEHYLSLPTIRALESLVDFFENNSSCRQKFLQHCEYRKEKGLGLIDGYQE
ncbi:iron (metal) dependent repressor, DtxR family [Desulfotomaculum arcticum]|uniref:Manganese transport regulator n=1 Tax=Desulfotruncus arcticus DSM 17038 TaxID=1121424 RepID=A0A1I2SUR3_9FIRM|nr:iron dependent repressor, metal binding and dimerization domain protein [Desulfotruncus arcticus]SFG56482.1 iron (metal) dependent repressor, DtxR family [Desulfotomaculum arcticum] [Desulfotruncus arcticus DSM 17038]